MGDKTLFEMLDEIEGRLCQFETEESAYRTEVVDHVVYRTFEYNGTEIKYPMKICFDKVETDFVHVNSLKSVKTLGAGQ